MRKLSLTMLAVAVTLIVTACSSSSGSSSASSSAGSSSSGGSGGDLTGKTWHLTAITEKIPAFQGVVPDADQANYTIEFKADGSFQAKADCNQVSGRYTTTASGGMTIALGPSTLVACPEGSLGTQYVTALGDAGSYAIANGQLTITLKDEGTLVFK
jgi:heat shock protein HslJ